MDPSPEDLGLALDLSHLPSEVRDLIRHGHRGQYPSRSEAAVAVCTEMFRAGYGAAEIWMVMTEPTYDISKLFFSRDGEQAESWLERLICEAYEALNQSERDDE